VHTLPVEDDNILHAYSNCPVYSRVEDPDSATRLYLYSAHDTTVAAMTTALGVYNNIIPPYAAALMIELYNDTNG
jgi:hypothetical protein